MTVIKRFAQDDTRLDDCMDQLVEVLAQLLDEKPDPGAIGDLHSRDTRVIHVVGENPNDNGLGA
jgi:hypothetical protein